MKLTHLLLLALWIIAALGCQGPLNDPYPARERRANIFYTSFSERPKHLDPAVAYSSDEYRLIAQIYEPPLQYHYLKRPYTLVPLAASELPQVRYFDAAGRELPADTPAPRIAYSEWRIHIRPGMRYQPHPAFARDAEGRLRYRHLSEADLEDIASPADFPHQASREVTAEDFVYQIKRLVHPQIHSPIAGLMQTHIVGLKDFARAMRQRYEREKPAGFFDVRPYGIEGVKVVDRYTYTIRIHGKYPQFKYWLAMPFFAPMPWEADVFYHQRPLIERNLTLDWFPVGSGPYLLLENNPNRRMVLARNPNFHGETYPAAGEAGDAARGLLADAGRPLPFIDRIHYIRERESIPAWNKFLQGYYEGSGIGSDSFEQAIRFSSGGQAELTPAMQAKGIQLRTAVAPSIFYLGFNLLDPVVGGLDESHRKLRQALSIAIDYEEYIAIFANGRGIPAQGVLPPGIFGYRPGPEGINPYVYRWQDGRPVRKPIAEAKRLLAEAGFPNGRDPKTGAPLLLYFDVPGGGPDDKARLNWYRKQFAKLGIQLVVRATDYNRFQEKMRTGAAQIFTWGWNADYPDPENFFFLLYGPNGKVKYGGENAANYANPEFDRLFERMRAMDDGPERQALIDRMQDIVRRDAPWVFGFHPKNFALYHQWLYNLKPNLMANNTVKYLRLNPDLRAGLRARWNRPLWWPLLVLLAGLALAVIPAWLRYRKRMQATAL
ncbi:oligopeptide transport system substrate-binding protein [Methylomarinovum caldicuralii]|uniref:Oligopeptide transport system substrate-binding protein n=1 Tax=Methylomarinovum caldicuralii TaxID=438856 RepID=A0AAU9C608_9GAMM|nr:ABC transporter substrate-binding protein [Methylomarinovum caldicuralii]BCX80886.1 oligopeptide transport system substrate-binding protein [Methylomarinovum caldicuralii]